MAWLYVLWPWLEALLLLATKLSNRCGLLVYSGRNLRAPKLETASSFFAAINVNDFGDFWQLYS